ncbi:MAG TPA: amino acid adenylation domain-containing protein, partial [Thermoanaerobaculia bacterium]|nr:amino acid adenylation domain-containing protein [Thermoanaerobaculia bacterium]
MTAWEPKRTGISREDLDLLQALLAEEEVETRVGDSGITAEDGPPVLSFAQQRLVFLALLDPDNPAYNVFAALRLSGPIARGGLGDSLDEVVRRHEVLRTTFAVGSGPIVPVVAPAQRAGLPVIDLSALGGQGEAVALDLARAVAQRPFDVQQGPLLQAMLVRLGGTEHVLLLSMHHVVSDGWSSAILIGELVALYRAFLAGGPSPLAPLSIQYRDFARWQREHLRGDRLAALLGYWKEQLAGAPPPLELPADRPRPARPTHRGGIRHAGLAPGLAALVASRARAWRATPFMVLLTAFAALLHRYSGQPDVVVGSPIANRNRAEIEPLIGFFVNTLVLRTRMESDPAFSDLVEQVRAATLGAYDHQDLPFERLVEELQPERELHRTPLFQVAFAYENDALILEVPEVILRPLEVHTGSAKFDLTLEVAATGEGLRCALEYSWDLFDASTAERMLAHWTTLLRGGIEASGLRLSELPLLTAAERHQLQWEWQGQESWSCDEEEQCLHRRFVARARQMPDAVAVVHGAGQLSYGELDRRSERLARRLRASGVRAGDCVGLCSERSAATVIGILGILKAGAAYVPIEPGHPRERLEFLLSDARVTALVVGEGGGEPWRTCGFPVLELAAEGPAGEPLDLRLASDLPAYVIYTSGSTGRPKGVVVSHRNVARLFRAAAGWLSFGPEQVWTFFHSFAFDFSVWEIWGALLYGGRLVVVPYLVSRTPEEMLALLVREGVTVLSQTPSSFASLLRARATEATADRLALRWVIFGGEALEERSLGPWWERQSEHGPVLVNMYGITETTVHVTHRRLAPAASQEGRGSGIGAPLADLRLYVLDPQGEPVPIGVAGELYVGGPGLALGYLGRPELTADRFLPDRFGGEAGGRLYRTGDLGRHLPQGRVEYLGRIDHQVKVRGFRIELGEIEAALAGHPAVREAVVVMREETGLRRLVGYVVPAAAGEPAVEDLRRHLLARLPEYMVPAQLVILRALPLTVNGKVDRRALPTPGETRPDLEARYVAPRTVAERALAEVWSQALGVDEVGIEDNFFALGGDSILALQLVALARERGLGLTLQELFRFQTVASLASKLGEDSGAPDDLVKTLPFELVAAGDRGRMPDEVEDAYPLAALQAGMLYHMEMTADDPLYHNVDSWHLRGRFEEAPFREAVQRAVARHPALRTSFHLSGFSESLQMVHRRVELPCVVEDLRHLPESVQEQAVAALVEREKSRLFNLTQAPQLRFHVFLRTADRFQFTLTENHAIFDGWSLHATLSEIFETYSALLAGEEPPQRPAHEVFYRDFVHQERATLASPQAEAFWEGQLADSPATCPPGWPTPPCPAGSRRRSLGVAFSRTLSSDLERLAQRAGAPLKSVLLAGHLKALSALTGQRDLITGLVANGRPEVPGGDDVRGLFLNTLPLRVQLEEGSWIDLVRAAFHAEQAVLPFRRYPYAALQRRWGRGQLLVETHFNFVHFHVISGLLRSGKIAVLDFKRREETEAKLGAQFTQSLEDSRVLFDLEYDAGSVPEAQAQVISGFYLRIFEAMARAPEESHDAASSLSVEQRHQILCEWSGAASGPFPEQPLLAALEEHLDAAPDRVAVVAGDVALTYAGMVRRARGLACRLRGLGVRPEVPVGIFLERSPEQIVSLLAVLTAGGAYVPLDPTYPQGRLESALRDLGMPVVVTRESLVSRLPVSGAAVVTLDRAAIATLHEEAQSVIAGEGQLAYVIYTSGSTGGPKGVGVSRGALRRFVVVVARIFALRPEDRVLQFASLNFDTSIEEILPTLACGATLVLREPEIWDAETLWRRARERGLTVIDFPTAYWHQIARESAVQPEWVEGSPVRLAIIGGEAALPEPVAAWRTGATRDIPLLNGYGITETTVTSTFVALDRGAVSEASRWGAVPIGRPIGNSTLYLLDRFGQPVPPGVLGEITIGGSSLARGYLRCPDLTAGKFVPDPCSETPGARLYRTGDLGRFRPDGTIECLGRIDHQVKIRGFRIEPAEVEAVLSRHPAVREVVAIVRDQKRGDRSLVVYYSGAPTPEPELREFARQSLPGYLVPSAFTYLPQLPLLPSNKVDRARLPEPAETAVEAGEAYVAPRGVFEEVVAAIWQEVLGLERVSAESDFFALGGHSLLATQVVSRLRSSFGHEAPLRLLFEERTVAGLARFFEAAAGAAPGEAAASPLPPIEPAPRYQGRLPLSFAQLRLWFLHHLDPESSIYNLPAALRLEGALDPMALEQALGEVVRRHEVLRTTMAAVDGEPYLHIHPSVPAGLPLVDLSRLPGPERAREEERLTAQEAARAFDLERGPVFRLLLVRSGARDHILLAAVHHIAADGWSMSILVRELGALYAAFTLGEASPLRELAIQYSDFAWWQRQLLGDGRLAAQLAYWRDRLHAPLPVLRLPADKPRPAVQAFRAGVCSLALDPALAERLRSLSRRLGATLFMTLIAGFKILLHRYTGQEDVVVGTPVAGRNHKETEGLIGVFLNTLALRTDLAGQPAFEELLWKVRETCLEAYAHQDVPFERLLEEIQPDRDLGQTPIFQVFFNMLNVPPAQIRLPGLTVSEPGIPELGSKFDWTVYVSESDGLRLDSVYNADLFAPPRMEEASRQLAELLAQIAEAPERSIGEYSLLTGWASALLPDPLAELPFRWEGSIVDRVADWAWRTPERTAILERHGRWTYGQLEERSDRIASLLGSWGAGPGDVVAVGGARCAALVASLLGVWRAGAAFVILDPEYPVLRRIEIFHAVRPRALLTLGDADEWKALQEAAGLNLRAHLDHEGGIDPAAPGNGHRVPNDPDAVAYVAFTSGTTGGPKGIVGTHRPLSHFLAWQAETFALGPEDRVSMLSGLAYDPLLRDVFAPLWAGGTLVVPDSEDLHRPERLLAWLAESCVSVAHLTPSLGRLLTSEEIAGASGASIRLQALRCACFGGEALLDDVARRLRLLAPRATVVNFYGATETPQAMSWFALPPDEGPAGESGVPLGRGIESVQLLVLNTRGGLAGIGELGEIHVRTPYLALGYLGDETLTRERFLTNPATGRAADRMYRTGDLGRYLPSGDVEFAGRVDRQISVRGLRVEPAEIEAVLARHPGVERAVVAVRRLYGEIRLVAYLVPRGEPELDADALRSFLGERLPRAMVPASFVRLGEISLTPSRKVDWEALPEPGGDEAESPYAAPRSEAERRLAAIWSDLLDRQSVGIHDNFFALGGDSILSIRVVSRLRQAGYEVSPRQVFQHQTIARLATVLRPAAIPAPSPEWGQGLDLEAVARQFEVAGGLDDAYPLSPLQEGLLYHALHDSGLYVQQMWCAIDGELDVAAFEEAWRRLTERHAVLRTSFH